jgi:hypothetical protein
MKWFQRYREREMLEGYSLTTYFMAKASERNKRNKIVSLIQEDNINQGDHNWLLYATDFYKKKWMWG